jgi:hypothetical protein
MATIKDEFHLSPSFQSAFHGRELVYDQNQVLVSGKETKVQFRYWYRSRSFFSGTEFFSFKFFSCFLPVSWEYEFLKSENIEDLAANLVQGPFCDRKKYPNLSVTRFFL